MRKTGALVFLAVVMVVVYARLFFQSGPSVANAKPAMDAAPVVIVSAPQTASPLAERIPVPEPLSRDIQGDPFAIDPDKFPLGPGAKVQGSAVIAGRADEAIRQEAKDLVLQSTVSGDHPMACIDGQFLKVGQDIAGFVLEQVQADRVILRREGVQVVLFLKSTPAKAGG
jgi:hypothetical protein